MKLFQFVYLVSILVSWEIVSSGNECKTPQFFEIGSVGVVQCSVPHNISGAFWYKLTAVLPDDAFLTLVNSVKSGEGFLSGEFDIYPNGSLIIQNVSVTHEGTYKVTMWETSASDPKTYFVNVFVIAPTFSRVPAINNCKNKSEICFQTLNSNSSISCTIKDARPEIPLRWMLRTGDGDRNISFSLLITNATHPFLTSRVTTTNAFVYTRILTLLVCKAYHPLGLLEKNESLVLIQGSDEALLNILPKVVYAKQDSRVNLNCSGMTISYLAWQVKELSGVIFKDIVHAIFVGNNLQQLYDEEYELQNTSIVVDNIRVRHEGTYRCISGNGFQDDVILYELIVFVYPDPAYPVVAGCNHQQYCVLEVPLEGSLTCTLKGIRPQVQLDITGVFEGSANALQIYDKTITIRDHGDTSDVFLTSHYRCKSAKESRLTVECKVVGTNIKELHLSTKFDLLFLHAEAPLAPNKGFPVWILAVVIPMFLLVIFIGFFFIQRGQRRSRNQERRNSGLVEEVPMFSPAEENIQSVQRITLLKELKTKYKDQYDAVQPIPYIRDRLYCVDRVFVEGGFEKLISQGRIEGYGNWEKLNSYHEVLNSGSSSTRTIIEGDPGYGKSTLTLQMAYDWCNRATESPLANVGIFILLRLRQLGGVPSVFKAIKQFILPRDSILEETDIATVMYESKSTVIILDGYDEYPEEETNKHTDIISMIRREMFQDNLVILTTRSSLLPKSYPPNTQRIRLTGFDAKARDTYIRKAVVGEDKEAAEKIKRGLHNNPVLQGLCQVPLFFVMFAHMTHESETFLKFNSVTSFFRHMINCFHSHLRNKQKDPNVNQFTLLEDNHDVLDEIAFERLSGKNQKIVWEKRELTERLGFEFYDHYKRIGILVEEEVLDLEETPGKIQYKVEVRFYHKLFCEWYAAHCLSRKVVQPEVNLNKLLEHMNPFDLQYTYRFVCGLNSDSGDKIIEYLRGIKDGDKFAVLCILEQCGKIDQIKDTIRDMCSNYIIIDNNDSLLLQGSIVQLLEIGAGNQMPISYVWLKNCFNSVDASTGSILLKSELSFPVLVTVEELAIGEQGRNIGNDEVSDILDYALMCTDLKILRFCHCMLPPAIEAKSLSPLQSKNVQVLWIIDEDEFCLNLRSGKWKNINGNDLDKIQEAKIQAKKNLLISLTKQFYTKLTSTIQPVASDQQNVYAVDEVFVDGGIEGLTYTEDNDTGRWEEIASYESLFSDSRFVAKRRLIKGKAGFGKSTLALKMAHDWCNSRIKSPLSKIEIFFCIRLRQIGLSKHIYAQIKHDALPKDTPLSGHDIKQVLQNCTTALIVLDDVNFYSDKSNDLISDVTQIVQGKMLSSIDVIMMSTSVPEKCVQDTKHVRLTGFEDKRRVEYMQKVSGDGNTLTADKVKLTLRENSLMNYFCKVPFFFVLFVHKIHENKQLETCSKKADLSKCILGCFHCHFVTQMGDNNSLDFSTLEKINLAFGTCAFEGLCRSNHGLEWSKDEMINNIGQLYYDYYVQMGILVEHEIRSDFDGDSTVRDTISQVKVQFYDNEFVYWYAAYYVAKGEEEWSSRNMTNAVKSSSYLKTLHQSANNHIEFAMLWISDQEPFVSGVLDIVKELCSRELTFDNGQSEVLQSSMHRVLEIASNNKISISRVWLRNCYNTVDLRGGNHLQLKSNLSIPVLTTLNELWIHEDGREITSEEFTGILQYSSKCLALKELWFIFCLLPPSVQAESVSVLRSRNFEVFWCPSNTWYQLNLQSCLWEYNNSPGRKMTDEDYQREVEEFREKYGKG